MCFYSIVFLVVLLTFIFETKNLHLEQKTINFLRHRMLNVENTFSTQKDYQILN